MHRKLYKLGATKRANYFIIEEATAWWWKYTDRDKDLNLWLLLERIWKLYSLKIIIVLYTENEYLWALQPRNKAFYTENEYLRACTENEYLIKTL